MRKNTLVGFLAIALVTSLTFAVRGWGTCQQNIASLDGDAIKHEDFMCLKLVIPATIDEIECWFSIKFLPKSWRESNARETGFYDHDLLTSHEYARRAYMDNAYELITDPVAVQVEGYIALLFLTLLLLAALIWSVQRKEPLKA